MAWIFSILMITFSSIAFLTLIALINGSISKHWSRWLIAVLFFILWIITLIFSITSTIAGQYNKYIEMENSFNIEQKDEIAQKNEIILIRENKSDAELRRNDFRKRLNVLLLQSQKIQNGDIVNGETWVTIQSRILATNSEIEKLDKKIVEYREKELKILQSNPIIDMEGKIKRSAFYDWIANIFTEDKEVIRFWMIIFPSLFLDILSPAALSIFMFLKRKKEY